VTTFVIQQLGTAWYFRGADAASKVLRGVIPNMVIVGLALSLARTRAPLWHQIWLVLLPLAVLIGVSTRRLM
jgi:hypothetical protein